MLLLSGPRAFSNAEEAVNTNSSTCMTRRENVVATGHGLATPLHHGGEETAVGVMVCGDDDSAEKRQGT